MLRRIYFVTSAPIVRLCAPISMRVVSQYSNVASLVHYTIDRRLPACVHNNETRPVNSLLRCMRGTDGGQSHQVDLGPIDRRPHRIIRMTVSSSAASQCLQCTDLHACMHACRGLIRTLHATSVPCVVACMIELRQITHPC